MELLGETLDERIQRLAVRDAERREQLRQDLEELHHKDRPRTEPRQDAMMPWRLDAMESSKKKGP